MLHCSKAVLTRAFRQNLSNENEQGSFSEQKEKKRLKKKMKKKLD